MTNLRKAAEMALEVLLKYKSDDAIQHYAGIQDSITFLRQALSEPANSTTGFVEPVAWIEIHKDYLAVSADPFENSIPVYTAPLKREWVGLTDEEKGWCGAPTLQETVARVEAKLKDKNT